ncbi:MAG: hydrogenase [Spartobacteria bacterium]|nr:hydrogenase [Spartobacteria bacterium]
MLIHLFVALTILINLQLLSSSRLGVLIRAVAAQAFLLSVAVIWSDRGQLVWFEWLLAGVTLTIKCVVLPMLIRRSLVATQTRREVEPLVGYTWSLLFGLILLGLSLWVAWVLPLPEETDHPLVLATSFFTIGCGLFLIISRSKAITQTIGYLTMENGIYALGLAAAVGNEVVVEMGILLDVFVAVFVMGITILHINREFDHIDTHAMAHLKD